MPVSDSRQEISDIIIQKFLPGEHVEDLSEYFPLTDTILDSLKCLILASWLEEHFSISIDADEIYSDNFDSVAGICNLVESKRAKAG